MIFYFLTTIRILEFMAVRDRKRTVALSLKLAELELVKNLINDTPVLLFDDVLSELDSERQNHFT